MEAFHKEPNTYRGTEVLYFENAELTKFKGDKNSFSTFGSLSILYFKDFKRFVLQLNDWRYPLFRRVPITKEGNNSSPSYTLPGLGESSYRLSLSNIPSSEGLANFETILNHNADFSSSGEENTLRKLELSPDDKLYRHTGPIRKESSGVKSTISGALKTASNKVKGLKGSKGASKKKRSVLKDIKVKDFKTEAKSTFKKNYFETSQKLSEEFLNRRKSNINLSQVREFSDLRKTSDNLAAGFFIRRDELEESILTVKDIITERGFTMDPLEKKGLMDNIRHGIHGIKDSITGIIGGNKPTESTEGKTESRSERRAEGGSISQNRPSREIISVHDKIEKVPAPEGMSHYQA